MRGFIALLAVGLAGCGGETGFAIALDVTEQCSQGATSLELVVTVHPSEATRTTTVSTPPLFVDGHRRVVVIPPADATSVSVTVHAIAKNVVLNAGTVDVPVSGHQIVEKNLPFGTCAGPDMSAGPDLGPVLDLYQGDLAPVVLTSISLTPVNPKVPIGNSIQLAATGTYSDNSTKDVTDLAAWSSNDGMVAMVGDVMGMKGTVTAGMNPGAVVVSAKVGNVTGVTAVAVIPATLMTIVVAPSNPTVANGSTLQFVATGIFSDNSNQDISSTVTWSSTNGAVASVSNLQGQKGRAAALMPGLTMIQAMQANVTGSTALGVTAATLLSIVVTPANPSIAKGTTQQFQATGTYSDNTTQDLTKLVKWVSTDETVATVDVQGLASGVAMGAATISAKMMMKTGSTTLMVSSATLKSIAVNPNAVAIAVTTSQQLQAFGTYSDNSQQNLTSSVTWSSSNDKVVPVSNAGGSQGLATGVAPGMVDVTATFNGISGMGKITVSNATLNTITVTPKDTTLQRGTIAQYKAVGMFSDNSTQDLTTQVTWSTGSVFVAAISNVPGTQGLLQANNAGLTSVWAQRGGVFGITNLTVSGAKLVSITVTPVDQKLAMGTMRQYTAMGNFDDNSKQDLTDLCFWWSTNTLVATVSNNGNKGFVAVVANNGSTVINAWANGIQGMTNLFAM